jgi:hypothetical protein
MAVNYHFDYHPLKNGVGTTLNGSGVAGNAEMPVGLQHHRQNKVTDNQVEHSHHNNYIHHDPRFNLHTLTLENLSLQNIFTLREVFRIMSPAGNVKRLRVAAEGQEYQEMLEVKKRQLEAEFGVTGLCVEIM